MRMQKPKNETRRLKVLWQYDVLDTVPEEVFDDLTDLAANICEAPIALTVTAPGYAPAGTAVMATYPRVAHGSCCGGCATYAAAPVALQATK